jgi:8-oxo-dGTP pyrophosphatase MutT (NUDIX family)
MAVLQAETVTEMVAADVVVARAFIERDGDVLLIRRAAWDTLPGEWELPGGKVDPGEAPLSAVIRELAEETGLLAVAAPELAFTQRLRSPSGRRVHERVYRVPALGAVELSEEHDRHVWFEGRDLGGLTESAGAALCALRSPRVRLPGNPDRRRLAL